MAEDKLFCTQCGAEMEASDQFCPSCGARVDGGNNPYRGTSYNSQGESEMDTTRMLILLYGIAALALGVLALIGSSMLNDPAMQQAMIDAGFDVNMSDLAASATLESIVVIASGACAILSSHFVNNRTNYTMALILCLAAAATSLILFPLGIITLVVGIYMAYRIKKGEALFH